MKNCLIDESVMLGDREGDGKGLRHALQLLLFYAVSAMPSPRTPTRYLSVLVNVYKYFN